MPSDELDSLNQARLEGVARGLTPEGLIGVAWGGCGLACFFVLLRCYVRCTESRRLYSDDYWILAAFVFLVANAILQTLQTPSLYYLIRAASGQEPGGEALLDHGNTYVRYQFVIIVFFWSTTWSVKYAFLALYYRLFNGLCIYRKVWWGVVGFSALAYVGCWISSVWTCHPPSTYFKFGQCSKPIDIEGSVISISYSTAVDVLTDLMIMALPIKLLTFLNVSKTQRLALVGIFSVGVLVIACALLRLTQIVAQARSDPVGLAVWSLVEGSMSVVVGSLPALKGFFGRAWVRTVKRRSGQMNASDVPCNNRNAGPGRLAVSDGLEKSWASASAAPLRNGELDAPHGRWSSGEQSPAKPPLCTGIDDDERMLRSDSISDPASYSAVKTGRASTTPKG